MFHWVWWGPEEGDEEGHCSSHGRGVQDWRCHDQEAEGWQPEGVTSQDPGTGRRGRAGLDLPVGSEGVSLPHANSPRKYGGAACWKASSGRWMASSVAPRRCPTCSGWRAGGAVDRATAGPAVGWVRELVPAVAGAAGSGAGDRRLDQPQNRAEETLLRDPVKDGVTCESL